MNKTAINKLLVAERKSMREKQRQSAFLRKTNTIFQSMKRRATEFEKTLNFDIDWFRGFVQRHLGRECAYCPTSLTVVNFCVDHGLAISQGGGFLQENLFVCCKPCNFQKGGVMDSAEFCEFRARLEHFRPEVQADIKRRLTIGGRWAKAYGAK